MLGAGCVRGVGCVRCVRCVRGVGGVGGVRGQRRGVRTVLRCPQRGAEVGAEELGGLRGVDVADVSVPPVASQGARQGH